MTPYLTLCREFVAIDSCAVLIAHEILEVLPVPSRLKTGASPSFSGKILTCRLEDVLFSGKVFICRLEGVLLGERSKFEGSDFSHGEAHPAT